MSPLRQDSRARRIAAFGGVILSRRSAAGFVNRRSYPVEAPNPGPSRRHDDVSRAREEESARENEREKTAAGGRDN
jgi:hypothetical protein